MRTLRRFANLLGRQAGCFGAKWRLSRGNECVDLRWGAIIAGIVMSAPFQKKNIVP